jgi:diamine N-acetyltransferase
VNPFFVGDYEKAAKQLHQLYCNVKEDNTASINLFESKGFKLIGTKKDWLIYPTETKNELMYQLVQS